MRIQSPSRRTVLTSALASMAVGGCARRLDVRRFRLNLEFIEEGRAYRGSSVREAFYTEDISWLPSDNSPNYHILGEATGVRLSRGRVIFGMMDYYPPFMGAGEDSTEPIPAGETAVSTPTTPIRVSPPGIPASNLRRPVSAAKLPSLVIFNTPETPGSGLLFDPLNLESAVPGLSLGRCTIETTDQPISYGNAKRLVPWIDGEPIIAARRKRRGSGSTVSTQDFIQR